MKNRLGGLLISLMLIVPEDGNAQSFDPLSEDGAVFTASVMLLMWLGLEQGIVEACNGDVSQNGLKFVALADAAESTGRAEFFKSIAGIFGEGTNLGRQAGCDVDKLRLYSGWADLYYDAVLTRLSQR
jgi:hypothetical protein